MSLIRFLPALAVVFSGCATVATPIPPSEYESLNHRRTVRVTPREGDWYETSEMSITDSTLTIVRPHYAEWDQRRYPVTYRLDEIESVASIKHVSLVYIESGVEHGSANHGAASQFYSETLFVIDMGYLSGERSDREHPRWGFGGTIMTAMGEDFRMGAKARIRYRMSQTFSLDATAGPMLTSWNDGLFNGFVGGMNLNAGPFSFRSEYMTYKVPSWTAEDYSYPTGHTYTHHPGGYEKVWYNGVAFQGTLGWVTAGVGTVAMFVYVAASFAALAGSN